MRDAAPPGPTSLARLGLNASSREPTRLFGALGSVKAEASGAEALSMRALPWIAASSSICWAGYDAPELREPCTMEQRSKRDAETVTPHVVE